MRRRSWKSSTPQRVLYLTVYSTKNQPIARHTKASENLSLRRNFSVVEKIKPCPIPETGNTKRGVDLSVGSISIGVQLPSLMSKM